MGQAASETQYDDLLTELIDDVAGRINAKLPHVDLRQTTYTEYHPGGAAYIVLKRRPLISVTSIHDDTSHEFGSDVLVAATDYFTEPVELSIVRKKSGTFQIGPNNLKVIYEAGFESIPPDVRRMAVERVVAAHARRKNPDMKTQGHREGTWERRDMEEDERAMDRVLSPYV